MKVAVVLDELREGDRDLINLAGTEAVSRLSQSFPHLLFLLRRSALFKNPLFFSGKFLGCYIEAAQNFFRYVPFLSQIGHKKITLLNWFYKAQF